jgi:twitching motility protein PilU
MLAFAINTVIPTPEQLYLPKVYSDLVMMGRGLILVVGQTGSGKSTSLAAMIGHRNRHGTGHIITIEDPIEFVHQHHGCIISQRDVGIDTFSFGIALKNALRQRPDLVLIGEVRDRETMEHAINFSETGHLCLATLHANNANQAIERILSFFPEEKHPQIRLNLSLNLKAILSQRLILNLKGTRSLAAEVMLNNGLIKSLIEDGKIREIKEMMHKGTDQGIRTFDQSIFELYSQGIISEEIALSEADNLANMKLNISQSTMAKKQEAPPQSPTVLPSAPFEL